MLTKIKTPDELAFYLNIKKEMLYELNPQEHYKTFYIPKPGKKEKRLIETPVGVLRTLLDRLSDGFQWAYLDYKTDAAYGFIRSLKADTDKRNIYTNAQRHLGKEYLINIDLDVFFHQVDDQKIHTLLSDDRLFAFSDETEKLLVKLVSYNGRLPMGSPTSPPLSNFAALGFDKQLARWARGSQITYTRYVDDLTFSSNKEISAKQFAHILEILRANRFVIDENKTKQFGKEEVKEVTGLILDEDISVPDDFLKELEKEIEKYHQVVVYANQLPDYKAYDWINKLQRSIEGRISFIGSIHGRKSEIYRKLSEKLYLSNQVEEDEISVSWKYAGYDFEF